MTASKWEKTEGQEAILELLKTEAGSNKTFEFVIGDPSWSFMILVRKITKIIDEESVELEGKRVIQISTIRSVTALKG